MPTWFRFEKAANVADIYIFDFIGDWIDAYWGFGTTAQSFLDQLTGLGADITTIRVHINSPGGDVFAALTMANLLRDQRQEKGRTVEVIVEGLAASAASIIAMGGNPIRMADNALMMIHDPWSIARGNAADFRHAASELDAARDAIVATYRWHSKLSRTELNDLMAQTTYFSATEAVEAGLATAVVPGTVTQKAFPAKVIADLKIPARHEAIAKSLTAPARTFTVTKTNAHKKQVFGWASVAINAQGQTVVDAHQHVIAPDELEHAVYQFNLLHRELDENHTDPVEGHLIESLVVTPDKLAAMGLSTDALPLGWWVGFQLTDEATFAKVLSGEYTMFSIAGSAIPVPVE